MLCNVAINQLDILPIRKVVADSIGKNDQCFQNLLESSEMEQIRDVKVSFKTSAWLF